MGWVLTDGSMSLFVHFLDLKKWKIIKSHVIQANGLQPNVILLLGSHQSVPPQQLTAAV